MDRTYLLRLSAGAHGRQSVHLELNGSPLKPAVFEGFSARTLFRLVHGGDLRSRQLNRLTITSPGAAIPNGDSRVVGIALRSLSIEALRYPTTLTFADEVYFLEGFLPAEDTFRRTIGKRARLLYPIEEVDTASEYFLQMRADSFGNQDVGVVVNGRSVGRLIYSGDGISTQRLVLPNEALLVGPNLVKLEIPDAAIPEGDSRLLSLVFLSLEISPAG